VAQPRWSPRARDYLLSVVELTTNRRWENRLPVERTARRPNDFSPWLQRAFQRHEFAPRRELMETRRGMPYALIKRDARASSLSRFARFAAESARSLFSVSLGSARESAIRANNARSGSIRHDGNSSVSRLRRDVTARLDEPIAGADLSGKLEGDERENGCSRNHEGVTANSSPSN